MVSYVVLKYIPGKSLEKFWPELTEDGRSAVRDQLKETISNHPLHSSPRTTILWRA